MSATIMTGDREDFVPKLGRIRARGGKASKRYLGKLYAKMEKARPGIFAAKGKSPFTGKRIGRGSAQAVAAHAFANYRARRVTVKIRSVRLGGNGGPKAQAHLYYIQRDGTDREHGPGKLYGPEHDDVDGKAFLVKGEGDRHQFRIILSPEDADALADLTDYTRDVMAGVENDLDTKLDWVAVNHYNTDHPHTHIVLRGKADDGRDLVIARNYITSGFRKRAQDVATLELGPRRDLEIAQQRFSEVEKERFTPLDRTLIEKSERGIVKLDRAETPFDRFQLKLLRARLRRLETMNMAARMDGEWALAPNLESALQEIGKRGDIIRSMHDAIGKDISPAQVRDFGDENTPSKLLGRVAGYGAMDDGHDKRFMAIDGADGNQWRIESKFEPGCAPQVGAIVEIEKATAGPKKSDRTIAAIAEKSDGVYSDELHRQFDASASDEYRLAHKRRLEALRRAGIVSREQDGSWRIPDDCLERAQFYERARAPTRINTLSWVALDQLKDARSGTLLDDLVEGNRETPGVDHGFGGDIRNALTARRQWLQSHGLLNETNQTKIDRVRLRELERTALNDAAADLEQKLGKIFTTPKEGEKIEGRYKRSIDLPQGRFAVVEKAGEFTIVRWRQAMEKQRGLQISGVMRSGRVSWTFGRQLSGLER